MLKMNQMSWKHKACLLLSSSFIALQVSCTETLMPKSGQFSVHIQWPENDFKVQVIPNQTSKVTVQIKGDGMENSLFKEFLRPEKMRKQRLKFSLPIGPKEIQVNALSQDDKVLASDIQKVLIERGKVTQTILDLKPSLEIEKLLTNPIPPTTINQTIPESEELSRSLTDTVTTPQKDPEKVILSPPPTGSSSPPPIPISPSPSGTGALLPLSKGQGLPQPNSSGGGSSSSGASSSGSGSTSSPPPTGNPSPQITSMTATPGTVSGLSFQSKIEVVATDDSPLVDSSYSWSCLPGCNNFDRTDSDTVMWTAPATPGGPYTITVSIADGINPPVTQNVVVSVQSGTVNLNLNGGQN